MTTQERENEGVEKRNMRKTSSLLSLTEEHAGTLSPPRFEAYPCYGRNNVRPYSQYRNNHESYKSNNSVPPQYPRQYDNNMESNDTKDTNTQHQHLDHTRNSDTNTQGKKTRTSTYDRICASSVIPIEPAEPSEPVEYGGDWNACTPESDPESKSTSSASAGRKGSCKKEANEDSGDNESDDNANAEIFESKSEKPNYKSSERVYKRGRDEANDGASDDDYRRNDRTSFNNAGREVYSRGREVGRYFGLRGSGTFEARITCKKKLWIGGIPSNSTTTELQSYFEVYGKVLYVKLSPRGNAFVKFATEAYAIYAYRQCYTAYIRGIQIKVKFALKRPSLPHNKLLYINGVPQSKTRSDVRKEFEKFGEVEDVQMFSAPYVYYFVTFVLEECAVKARKALKSKYFIQFGKQRIGGEDKSSHQEDDRTQDFEDNDPRVPRDISECEVYDVLEPLSEEMTSELTRLLNTLQPTNAIIRDRRDWIFKHYRCANDILLHISVMLVAKDNPFHLRLSTLYLVHDILSYCTLRRTRVEILDTISALTLPHLQRVIGKFRTQTEKEKNAVLDILSLWEKYNVFPCSVVADLRHKLSVGDQGQADGF